MGVDKFQVFALGWRPTPPFVHPFFCYVRWFLHHTTFDAFISGDSDLDPRVKPEDDGGSGDSLAHHPRGTYIWRGFRGRPVRADGGNVKNSGGSGVSPLGPTAKQKNSGTSPARLIRKLRRPMGNQIRPPNFGNPGLEPGSI
jgi:hypothetical protein